MSHLLGKGSHKGKALFELKKFLKESNAKVLALGDSQNDLPLLEAADIAVVVPGQNGPNQSLKLGIDKGQFLLAPAPHSEGWAIASTSRKKEKITSMKDQNWQPFFWNQEFIINFKKSAFIPDAIIVTVPPENNKSDPIFPILKPYLDEFEGWLGYISSTSVYASSNGEKTFENSPGRDYTRICGKQRTR